jgi:threonylcarbamoyladenosine tRNA methylthiotransferase MtaB
MSKNSTVSIRTVGCKLNQAESESLAREFAEDGHNLVLGDKADILVINTCSVTHVADRKSRQLIRSARRQNPGALIVVTGCYAEFSPGPARECGASLVIGNASKDSLPQMVRDIRLTHRGVGAMPIARPLGRKRSFMKIQDGCRGACSYCIVPVLRRTQYSADTEKVISDIRKRVAEGCLEVVLTGTEVGLYNHLGCTLEHLIKRVLVETEVERIHISSIQPQELSEGLLSLWQNPRMVKHFHMALQSGNDRVLKRMRRPYDAGRYRRAVQVIRSGLPDAAVTTDVIVGFPGESDAEFRDSYDYCVEIGFAALHVFSFSPRPGTVAAGMANKVVEEVKKDRSRAMMKLGDECAGRFSASMVGDVRPVLWQNELKPGCGVYDGFTDNYVRVYARCVVNISNTLSQARLLALARSCPEMKERNLPKSGSGDLWSELHANQGQGNAALIQGRGVGEGRRVRSES